jgi:general secretion pathway protein K
MSGGQRGFALLIVLWTMGFLALLGTQIVAAGRSDTQLADNLKQEAVLEAAADGVVAQSMFLLLAAKDNRLSADGVERLLRVGQIAVLVRVANENDRVNLNTASGVLLRSLILEVGGSASVADRLVPAILDWRTSGVAARPNGAKALQYQAAGRSYGPPGTTFRDVDELADVLGMTPDLLARLVPHVTVLTDGDPDMSTKDPVVARALADSAGGTDDSGEQPAADRILRIHVVAIGAGATRYGLTVVASANFNSAAPRVNILMRRRE